MSATGLDVLQTTHTWLDDIMRDLGPDRQRQIETKILNVQ